jgi:hypothetical protein
MKKALHEKIENGRIRHGAWGSTIKEAPCGAYSVMGPCGEELHIVASEGDQIIPWEHVSVSTKRRTPNWKEMSWVKDHFWHDEECVVQFHPPHSVYVNNHSFCLHLWRHKFTSFPLPPEIAVGVKSMGELT